MPNKNERAAIEMTSAESVQTNAAASAQEQPTTLPDDTSCEIASQVVGTEATTTLPQFVIAAQTHVDAASPAVIAKSLDQMSKVSIEGNPWESLEHLKPADQSTETVIEACVMLAESVTDFWRQYGTWLSELKRRMEVRNGSKGRQLLIGGSMLYWHEFLAKYFDVSRRQINRIEKELVEGTYKPLLLVEGERVVAQTKDGHTKEGTVTKVHQSAPKVDVDFGDGKEEIVAIEDVSKAKQSTIGKLNVNRLYVDPRTHIQYRYQGNGKLAETKAQPTLKAFLDGEAAKQKAKADRENAKKREAANREKEKKARYEQQELERLEKKRLKAEKKAAKAAKKVGRGEERVTAPTSCFDRHVAVVGDKSAPTAQGHYWEFRKHEKLPYVVRNKNHPDLGILVECPSKVTAEMMISKYDMEAV